MEGAPRFRHVEKEKGRYREFIKDTLLARTSLAAAFIFGFVLTFVVWIFSNLAIHYIPQFHDSFTGQANTLLFDKIFKGGAIAIWIAITSLNLKNSESVVGQIFAGLIMLLLFFYVSILFAWRT